jgi:aminomethyltransferase
LKGNAIGEVRSGTQSPSLGKAIGMGYVQMEYTQPESQIFIEIRGKLLEAKVVKVPFN